MKGAASQQVTEVARTADREAASDVQGSRRVARKTLVRWEHAEVTVPTPEAQTATDEEVDWLGPRAAVRSQSQNATIGA